MAQLLENSQFALASAMNFDNSWASGAGLEPATAEEQKRFIELYSATAVRKEQYAEMKKTLIGMTHGLDMECCENSKLLRRRVELLAAASALAGKKSVPTAAASAGMERNAKLRSLLRFTRSRLEVSGPGVAAQTARGADVAQKAADEAAAEAAGPEAGALAAREQGLHMGRGLQERAVPPRSRDGPGVDAELKWDLNQGTLQATQVPAPWQPAAACWQAPRAPVQLDPGARRGQQWWQGVACFKDLPDDIFAAGLEQAKAPAAGRCNTLLRPGLLAPARAEMVPAAGPPLVAQPLAERGSESRRSLRSLAPGVTTLTIRNVPARYTMDELIAEWGPGCSYDFVHLPLVPAEQRSKGYAFVNFTSPEAALAFQARWHGQRLAQRTRTRTLDVVAAPVQGYWANLQLIRRSLANDSQSDANLPATFRGGVRLDTRAELEQLPPSEARAGSTRGPGEAHLRRRPQTQAAGGPRS